MITKQIGENTFQTISTVDVKTERHRQLDWGSIFDTLHLIKQELQDNFPYKVLEVDNAEADDIIASIVSWVNESPSHYEKSFDCIW